MRAAGPCRSRGLRERGEGLLCISEGHGCSRGSGKVRGPWGHGAWATDGGARLCVCCAPGVLYLLSCHHACCVCFMLCVHA